MNTLEKILQEIEEKKKECRDICRKETNHVQIAIKKTEYNTFTTAAEIIKKHLSDKKCSECSRRKFYQMGYRDGKKDNDGWILVEDGLPKTNVKVDITFREYMAYSKKYRYERCNAVYIPKNTVLAEEMWSSYDEDGGVTEYDEKTDQVFVMDGWYETIENWGEYSHVYVLGEVVAWRPLTDPYKPHVESAEEK